MNLLKPVARAGMIAGLVALAACSGDFAGDAMGPDEASLNLTQTGYIDIIKVGPPGTYDFEASETETVDPGLYFSTFSLEAYAAWETGTWRTIWSQGNPAVAPSDVTITEVLSPGMQVDSIRVTKFTDGNYTGTWWVYGTNTVTIEDLDYTTDVRVKVFNSYEEGGAEGCTPGFWRQEQHFDAWTGYMPADRFDIVFGVMYGGTLLEAVWARGGGVDALARHSVAALLNATNPDVDYPATEAQVIAAVQAAFSSGEFEDQKDIFEGWNEAGCMDEAEDEYDD